MFFDWVVLFFSGYWVVLRDICGCYILRGMDWGGTVFFWYFVCGVRMVLNIRRCLGWSCYRGLFGFRVIVLSVRISG